MFKTKYVFESAVLIAVFLRLLDSYRSHNFLYNSVGFSSGFVLSFIFALIVILRVYGFVAFQSKFVQALISVGAIIILGTFILAVINNLKYENYIYGITQIHIDQLFNLGLFLFFTGFVSLPSKVFKKHYKLFIILLGLLLPLLYYMYGYFPLDSRHQIAKEDSLVENFQFLFVFLSGIYSSFLARLLYKKHKALSVLFVFAALGLLFVAGDEISWGQRIFGISSPEYFIQTNAQNEITVHNHTSVHGYTPVMFAIVAGYGAFMWVVKKVFPVFFKKHVSLSLLVPSVIFFPYFFTSFAYNFYTELGDHTIGDWSEPTELMLYLGVFLYIFVLYKTIKPDQKLSQ